MNKMWKKLFGMLMAIAVIFTTVMADVQNAYATEVGDVSVSETPGINAAGIEGDPMTVADAPAEINIVASTRIVSFGHIVRGTPTQFQLVTITSESSETIYLDYQMCDAENMFSYSTRDDMSLAPGQSATFSFGIDENKKPGYYTANMIFCPLGHVGATVNVGLSAEIVEATPSITYMGIKPASADLSRNATCTFSATVQGSNNANLGVTWRVEGNTSTNTTIDANGTLRVGANETATQFFVIATSVQDGNYYQTAAVRLKEGNYTVATSSNPAAGGSTAGAGTYAPGSNMEVYAAPNNGYRFTQWTSNGKAVSTNPRYTIKNIHENYNLVANFERVNCYVKVGALHPEGGTVSNSANVNYNGSFYLTASPKAGFVFEGWYEGGKRISGNAQMTINNIVSNREFIANFVPNAFKVQVAANPLNTGVVTGGGSFARGSKVTVTAKPVDGYKFDCWTVNGQLVSQSASYTITNLDKDYALVANFMKTSATVYTITSKVEAGEGTVTPNGAVSVPAGVDVTYVFAPAKNYTVSSVTVDGKNMGAIPSYTFKKVSGNHTVGVKFVAIPDATVHSNSKKPIVDNTDVQKKDVVDSKQEYKPESVEDSAIDSFLEYTELTGVLQEMNISEEQAREMIRTKNDRELLERACQNQYLAVSVLNEYADNKLETENASYMDVSSAPNFADVVDSLLTEDEKIEVFKGGNIGVNFNLFANNKIETEENKKIINQAMRDNVEVGGLFEAVLIKNNQDGDQMIDEIGVPMKLVLNVPQSLKADGREFLIMRAHKNADGVTFIDYLPNESTDQSQIIFTTDKFSSYAIVYRGGKSVGLTQADYGRIFLVALTVAIILTIVLLVLMVRVATRRRRARRRR